MFHTLTLALFSAQNNFRVMARYSDWPKKFLLGQVSFLMDQKWKKKPTNPFSIYERDFIFTKRQNLRFTGEDLGYFLRIHNCVT